MATHMPICDYRHVIGCDARCSEICKKMHRASEVEIIPVIIPSFVVSSSLGCAFANTR